MEPRQRLDIDQRALDLVISRSDGGALAKRLYLQRMAKAHKKAKRKGLTDLGVAALKRDSDMRWRLCNARMMLGHYGDWDGWEYRAEWASHLWINRPLGPPWNGRPTQRLYILGEQGIGDEILFAQCIPDAIAALGHRNIVFDTDPRLIPIFERSFGITCVPRMKITDERPGMSAWICLGDLLRLFRTGKRWNGAAYLEPDPARAHEFRWVQGMQAIAWKGLHGRYDPDKFVAAVGQGVDVQYDESHGLQPGIDKYHDLEGMFALLANVARLVSVSQSVVHMAAAIGTPVDLILAPPHTGKNHDQLQWRWCLHQSTTPWYDSVRIWPSLENYRRSNRLHLRNAGQAGSVPSLGAGA